MPVEVRRDGAFSVNSLGVAGTPFPLSFSVREAAGCWMVRATAAQAAELAGLLTHAARGTVAVLDVATDSFLDADYRQWTPSRIAAAQSTRCAVHDFDGLADGVLGLSGEALVMRRDELPGFLDGWYPYELTLVGLPDSPTAEQLDEIGLAVGTARHDRPILPTLPGCCLWFSGHDDCYVSLESTDREIPRAVLGRLLGLLAGSVLADTGVATVTDPSRTLIDALLARSPDWIGTLGATSAGSVTVNLTAVPEPWRLARPVPDRADQVAVYDVGDARWRLTGP